MTIECKTCDNRKSCMLKFEENCSYWKASKCYTCMNFTYSAKDWILGGCEKLFPSGCIHCKN